MILGVVLAGGRSRRFGSEKAVALFRGRPLLAHALDVLRADCEALAVSAAADSAAASLAASLGVTVIHDATGDPIGPLSGVKAGLAWAAAAGASHLATTPCDLPFAPHDLAARLAMAGDCAYAETASGPHPLCTLWPVGRRDRVIAVLAGGAHPSVRSMLAALNAVAVRFDDTAAFTNINAPDDLKALERPAEQ